MDPPWWISIHHDFDSSGGPLSPCGSHWLRLEPFTQIRSRTLSTYLLFRSKTLDFSQSFYTEHLCVNVTEINRWRTLLCCQNCISFFLRCCCYGDLKIGSQGFSKPIAVVGKNAVRSLYCGLKSLFLTVWTRKITILLLFWCSW